MKATRFDNVVFYKDAALRITRGGQVPGRQTYRVDTLAVYTPFPAQDLITICDSGFRGGILTDLPHACHFGGQVAPMEKGSYMVQVYTD